MPRVCIKFGALPFQLLGRAFVESGACRFGSRYHRQTAPCHLSKEFLLEVEVISGTMSGGA